ncbi:MAG: NADH-quinone oxidoreductase subunit C [candidate division Zixibacteria bacterium]|nr:NADH-quinone oxidoreductase subunit C [candidate division Zixibacteria bacterium]
MVDKERIEKIIVDEFGDAVTIEEMNPPQAAIRINSEKIVPLFEFIASHPDLKLNYLSTISGVDLGVEAAEIEIVYFVSSIEFKHKLTIKTRIARQGGRIDTISTVLKGANWYEREIWELFGVDFGGHPNLTRFLLPEDWDEGYPMLRDWQGRNFERMPES